MTASNGGDYVASRKALVSRYAAPWLLALHDLDITAYPGTLFEILSECVDEGTPFLDHYLLGEVTPKEKKVRVLGSLLGACVLYLTRNMKSR